jgi:hypothetical protein
MSLRVAEYGAEMKVELIHSSSQPAAVKYEETHTRNYEKIVYPCITTAPPPPQPHGKV